MYGIYDYWKRLAGLAHRMGKSMTSFPVGRFECPRCSKVYSWKNRLMLHIRMECGKKRNVTCPVGCRYRTHRHSLLEQHLCCKHNEIFYEYYDALRIISS
ncbi:longitudinals lacking protein, isoforms J/P/Q/S/Z-like [Macrosteles quadrilineatus]|uniref:longitudinals lacking protein, isoforms J/P/Q/S/Z-like n=1 Tax=Macrosteles quadrilineatus TaxID=74068 RepID=UPI0023E17294|nr:longitudinals lacking protein, isoforms J/P/Q/S/Z-like [Macrosteles quadrilineatus]